MKKIALIFMATAVLAGCGAFVPIETVETAGLNTVSDASKIKIVDSATAKTMQPVGEVIGYSCKNKIWDPAATEKAATDQVMIVAAQRKATAITELTCSEGSVSLITNCWQSYTCKATALR